MRFDFQGRAGNTLQRWLARQGWNLQRLSADERRYITASYDSSVPLPEGAETALRNDHPRLQELRAAYAALDLPVSVHSIWSSEELDNQLSLPWFRGDNAYVWQFRQLRSQARLKQYLFLQYVEACDGMGLLQRLDEDGQFGCWRFQYAAHSPVSRDLLDSVNEINFLQRMVGLSGIEGLRILDIGAGYGRLAHRMVKALSNIAAYDCVDAIAESSFLCEYYLRYREIDHVARAIPLHELESLRPPGSYSLAVNIHSFSECSYVAIEYWLQLISRLRVPWLLIVPNHPQELLSNELDGTTRDFTPLLESAGYELVTQQAVIDDAEIRELVSVNDHFFLFRQSNRD